MEWKKEDFTVTTAQIAKVQGLCTGAVSNYARKGAFPFARNKGSETRGARYFHESSLSMMPGEWKANAKKNKYEKPVLELETRKPVNRSSQDSHNMHVFMETQERIEGKIDALCEKLGVDLV